MTQARPAGAFDRPTSTILCGTSHSLLNWVAYSMAVGNPGGFVWTDLIFDGEVREDSDPLQRNLIPRDRYFEIPPEELVLSPSARNGTVEQLFRPEEAPETVRRLTDFLQLPPQIQMMISQLDSFGAAPLMVFSNGQRLSALYSWRTVGRPISSIVESGASLLVGWAEAPTEGRRQFETVLHLKGHDPTAWKDAVLRAERAAPDGPLRTGDSVRLRDFPIVSSVLEKVF